MPNLRRPLTAGPAAQFAAGALAFALAVTACTTTSAEPRTADNDPTATVSARPPAGSANPSPTAVAPFRQLLRPDVLVVAPRALPAGEVTRLRALSPRAFTTFRAGSLGVARQRVGAVGVDASSFRNFAPKGTAESDAVWAAVARGEVVVTHELADAKKLPLGGYVNVGGTKIISLRVGAFATTTLPDVDVIVSDSVAERLGLAAGTGVLLSSVRNDPTGLAAAARRVVGNDARMTLLTQPTGLPYAFLTGSKAAKAFGAFSYRYHPDGTIEPDARWVRQYIVDARVPILGVVRCHRMMVPQLRAALAEVEARGLARAINPGQYGGCYVPRFIERNPNRSISLHTWGIAVDFNVPGNMPGSHGELDRRVVAIFKKWGFRWGGDWRPTDPMHFELAALMQVR